MNIKQKNRMYVNENNETSVVSRKKNYFFWKVVIYFDAIIVGFFLIDR